MANWVVESKSGKRGAWVTQNAFESFNKALDYAVELSKAYLWIKIRVVDQAKNKVVVIIDK